jgi:hypothetical protein
MGRAFKSYDMTSRKADSPPDAKRLLEDSGPLLLPLDAPPGVPAFVPTAGLAGGHRQTAWAWMFPGKPVLARPTQRRLRLEDGDLIVLHDNSPDEWQRSDHVVLMMHGLCGSHQSGYMARLAARLTEVGVRTFRMDHRGCGAGAQLARNPYHAGRTEDLAAAIGMVERLCPGSPISVVGFSLSGNLLLKYLSEAPGRLPLSLFRAVAVCPPIDLHHCASALAQSQAGRRYDWYFTRRLISHVSHSPQWRDDLPLARVARPPRRLYEFDDLFTAPASGFRNADEYYAAASSKRGLAAIRVHTTILAAEDDPVVDADCFRDVQLPTNVTLCLTKRGGHLGFIGRRGVDPDQRWMDWRLMDWLLT